MKPDAKNINGAQKVAAFLLSLDKSAAAAVLKNLDPKIVSEVAAAMTELDPKLQDKNAVDALYNDLSRALHAPAHPRAAKDAELAGLLEAAIGKDRSKTVLQEIHERRRHERPFADVEKQPTGLVARALQEESPAIAALVLAHLDPKVSAEILSTFDPDRALDTVKRISQITPPGFETLNAVADALEKRISAPGPQPSAPDPALRLKTIAQMLTMSEKSVESAVLEGLEQSDKEMVGAIREFMFTWTDLATLDKRGMQKVLSSVETRSLAMALKACDPETENNILSNLSTRVRAMVAEERDLAGAVPMAEVTHARNEILKTVRDLLASGELATSKGGEELVK